jgi:hypothetical protein
MNLCVSVFALIDDHIVKMRAHVCMCDSSWTRRVTSRVGANFAKENNLKQKRKFLKKKRNRKLKRVRYNIVKIKYFFILELNTFLDFCLY